MYNEHGVNFGGELYDEFTFKWLGAPVHFMLDGQRKHGKVKVTDSIYKTLTVELFIGKKYVRVTAGYRAFRLEGELP